MKQYLGLILLVLLSITSYAQYNFAIDKSLKCTAVSDQQGTNTCWTFATSSFLESELLRAGKPSVNLSEMYMVRQIYMDKARNYLLRQGKANFAEGGLGHDVIHAMDTYGVVTEEAYPGKLNATEAHNHTELITVLKAVLDGMLEKHVVSDRWPQVVNAILDVYLGPLPKSFTSGSKSYSPEAYAESLGLNADDYVSITSFTHHPFYEKFVLEIPDNHANGSFYNVPLEDLTRIAKNAVNNGYTIAWDGDVSEKSFSAEHGLAILPAQGARSDLYVQPGAEKSVSAQERQAQFEDLSTTDDHLMHIVGTAHDQKGTSYYLLKNSWGEVGTYDGYLYMSDAYYQLKTISILVHRDAIPADIAAKIEL